MNFKKYKDKHDKGQLSDEEWEHLAQSLINAKFDEQQKERWNHLMAEEGVHRSGNSKGRISIRRWMTIAASFLIMLAVGGYFLSSDSDITGVQKIAKKHLEQPFSLYGEAIRGKKEIEKLRGQALEAYNNQHYEKALEYLQVIESYEQEKAADYFQMGLCLMYQKQPDYKNAVKVFDKAQSMDSGKYYDEINWFSSLCFLMIDDKDRASDSLNKVINSSSSRQHQAAIQLLEKLD